MKKIAICIPTYKRPVMLRKLVLSIIGCRLNNSLIKDVSIIIVDNDIERTAELIVGELKEEYGKRYNIQYNNYPVKGLANVRNELIRIALMLNPDYLVFVDDDEYVSPGWLNEFVNAITQTKADIIMGPVITENNYKISDEIISWIQRPDHPDYSSLTFLRTSNLIIDVSSLRKQQIWFDVRFNTTGGEDSFFGLQMLKKGATILWAAKAVVYEALTLERAKISWVAKRYYNGANKYAYILKIEKDYPRILKKVLVSLFYIIMGFFALILTFIPFRKRYWGLLKLSEGCGGIMGFLNLRYNAY